jgi:hypothetical protein
MKVVELRLVESMGSAEYRQMIDNAIPIVEKFYSSGEKVSAIVVLEGMSMYPWVMVGAYRFARAVKNKIEKTGFVGITGVASAFFGSLEKLATSDMRRFQDYEACLSWIKEGVESVDIIGVESSGVKSIGSAAKRRISAVSISEILIFAIALTAVLFISVFPAFHYLTPEDLSGVKSGVYFAVRPGDVVEPDAILNRDGTRRYEYRIESSSYSADGLLQRSVQNWKLIPVLTGIRRGN